MAVPSPPARRLRSPRWFDPRLVAGLLLVFVCIALGAKVIGAARATGQVWAAARELPAGSVLRADDLRAVAVRLPAEVDGYLPASAAVPIGQQVRQPISAGELIPRTAFGPAPSASTTVTVPVDSAAAPTVERGDRVVVWLSTTRCPALVVLPDVAVQDVIAAGGGSFTSSDTEGLVVRVSSPLATRVVAALAVRDGTIRVGVNAGPAAAPSDLRPVSDCAGAAT